MKRLEIVKSHLQPGQVYRREDLKQWSSSVDRHLQELVKEGVLEKLAGGLYYVPKQSAFGKSPASEQELLRSYLKDDRFVLVSPGDYNALGLGTTQLYNIRKVYNYKRHGEVKLGNRSFQFVRKPYVPSALTQAFLLVDLVNNLKHLSEDQPGLVHNIEAKVKEMDSVELKQAVNDFGTVGTKHFFASLLA